MIDLGTWASEEYKVSGDSGKPDNEHPDDAPKKNRTLH